MADEDRIRVVGPLRDYMTPIEDDEGNVVAEGYWHKTLFMEALGTDGNFHVSSFAFSDTVADEFIPEFIRGGKVILMEKMKSEGVW